jgi:hypothetical protein
MGRAGFDVTEAEVDATRIARGTTTLSQVVVSAASAKARGLRVGVGL